LRPIGTHVGHRRAHDHARLRDQHHLVVVAAQHHADHGTIAALGADVDHALAAAALDRIVVDRRALAEAVLAGGQEEACRCGDDHVDHAVLAAQLIPRTP
jgi:hypothetical protein